VALVPEQMVAEFTVTVGSMLTLTVDVLDVVTTQPEAFPLTVYTAVLVGLTEIVAVLAPVLQLYVLTPVAISVAVVPVQMVGEFTVMLGELDTVMPVVPVLTQFCADVPVIVKLTLAVGVTTIELLLLPLLQVYVDAPVTFNVAVPPAQTLVVKELITGKALTNTCVVAELTHDWVDAPVMV
jgi:hypothetical protein